MYVLVCGALLWIDQPLLLLEAPNRVGNIPLHWYDDLPHVGYDIDGKKVLKPARGDELDKFLKTVDDPSAWCSPLVLKSHYSG